MRNVVIVLLLIFAGVLGFLLHSQNAALRSQERQIQELAAKLDSMSKATSLDVQEKCAKQAREQFVNLGFAKHEAALLMNHYNQKLNKCFMRVDDSSVSMTWMVVSDAFEGTAYATLGLHGDEVRKCSVWLQSGEEKTCKTLDEFQNLIKPYME